MKHALCRCRPCTWGLIDAYLAVDTCTLTTRGVTT